MTAPVAGPGLDEEHFPGFFVEVNNFGPFPWQETLLHRVLRSGWPELLDVPTGLGKTATLDVAVFAAALGCEHARRRIFLVVDRRIIVDQAYQHALQIQRALAAAPAGSVCRRVAQRLAVHDDDGPVLDVTRMRGGVDWSWLWLDHPGRHAIITGTVDQIGSRLLFRGYGVGENIRSIDAALAGTDSLILVDEAHLSDVFMATLRDIGELNRPVPPFRPPAVVAMSASPGSGSADVHGISHADEALTVAARRLNAPRQLYLTTVPAAKDTAAGKTADALATWARRLGAPGQVTGVVVNTVAMAREVFSRLQAEAHSVLLTGRIRPVDREYLLHEWLPFLRAGQRDAPPGDAPVYVVATQTIEAGADIDLDALVTEAAALPALIQRLGRLNRRGDRNSAPAVLVHCAPLSPGIYGDARDLTWKWLEQHARPARHAMGVPLPGQVLDASPLALRALIATVDRAALEDLYGARPYAPMVFADTLAAWARTSPVPHPDVPAAPYLHGVEQGLPAVTLTWRDDMDPRETAGWRRTAELVPPSADEAIELPIAAVRRWLTGQPTELADTGAQVPPPEDDNGQPRQARQILRYRGPGESEVITAAQILPGDTLLAPARWGGCDRYGWHPDSAEPVTDVADLARGTRRSGATVRVSARLPDALAVLAPALAGPAAALVSKIRNDIQEDSADLAAYRQALADLAREVPPDAADLPHAQILRRLAASARLTVLEGADTDGIPALLTAAGTASGDDASPAGSSSSPVRRPLDLGEHEQDVAVRAHELACGLELPGALATAVTLAGLWHDEGKRDPRFQVMLHGGDRWQALAADRLLAKSGMDPADRAAFGRASRLSGYPGSMRHEDLSGRIAACYLAAGLAMPSLTALHTVRPRDDWPDLSSDGELDNDLVLHLIASHHGRARPLLPPVSDQAPVPIEVPVHGTLARFDSANTVDWDEPGRFAALSDRYGYWGLAALEAIVRLADIWCSARPRPDSPEAS